ncbi:MAG: PorV/PorQ family protein [Ignavibacteriaceae bacterium]
MRTFKIISLIFLLIFSASVFKAQGQLLQMLYLNPSPRLNGLGMVGTSLPNDDPFGFYYNPAQLGHFSQTNNLAYQFYPSNVNWQGVNSTAYRNSAVNIGYNFKKELNGLSLSAGFGYIHSELDYGTVNVKSLYTNAPLSIHPYDKFDAYSLGIGIDYYVKVNIGITYKSIYSYHGPFVQPTPLPTPDISASPTDIDYGILLTIPVVKLIDNGYKFYMFQTIPATPYFNISMGFAKLNQGGSVTYSYLPSSEMLLPRSARVGYTLSTGLNIRLHNSLFKVISYDFTVDADNLLNSGPFFPDYYSYKTGIGDIKIGRNLIELKGDNDVLVHKGHEFNFFETFKLMIGSRAGYSFGYFDKSSGFGMSIKGILTLLKGYKVNETFNFIADHFDIQYYSSKLSFGGGLESKFEGINFSFYGFEF